MSDLSEFTTALFFELRKPKGGAQLEMRVHEENYLEHGLMPPRDILESAMHHFTARDADTDTLEAMLAACELEGGDITFARPERDTNPASWSVGDEVEVDEADEGETEVWVFDNTTFVRYTVGKGVLVLYEKEEVAKWRDSADMRLR